MAAYNYSSFYSPDNDNSLSTMKSDYLKDPELWRDSLPQPYRMINDTLQELLMAVFEEADSRRIFRESQSHLRKVPIVSDATLMMCLPMCNILATAIIDGVDHVIGCGSTGIHICHLKRSSSFEESSNTSLSAQMDCDGHIECISVQSRGGAIFIALVVDHNIIRILVYKNQSIHSVCQIDINSDQMEGTHRGVPNLSLSPSSVSHLALSIQTTTTTNATTSEGGGGEEDVAPVVTTSSSSVALYSLPIDQWMQQLQSLSDDNQQVVSFSGTPSLMYTLSPPLTTPSPANDPVQIMKLIQDKSAVTLPVDNISITDTYLKSRRHLFQSQPHRRDFVHNDVKQESQQSCLLEFLFHYDGIHSSHAPLAVAVAWEKTFQLLIYQMNKKANANMMADKVYLQGSYITSITVNIDTTLLCLGLESGNISIINMKRGIALGVVNLCSCSEVTIVKFAPVVLKKEEDVSSQQPVTIIGGCGNGSVHCIEWTSLTEYTHKTINSGNNQCESAVRDILFCNDIPTVVITEHDNGGIIAWQWLHDYQPLCALSLLSPFQHIVQPNHCNSLVGGADSIVAVSVKAVGKNENDSTINNSEYAVFSWSLSTCEVLRRTLIDSYVTHSSPAPPKDNIIDPMDLITNLIKVSRKSDEEMNEIMKECWKKLDEAQQQYF